MATHVNMYPITVCLIVHFTDQGLYKQVFARVASGEFH